MKIALRLCQFVAVIALAVTVGCGGVSRSRVVLWVANFGNAMRRRAIQRFVPAIVRSVWSTSLAASILLAPSHEAFAQARVAIPAVACPLMTMLGPRAVSVPRYIRVDVSTYWASRIAYYTIGEWGVGPLGRLGAFGPRGWHCQAHSGTGGAEITAFPGASGVSSVVKPGRIGLTAALQAGYGGHYVQVLQTGAPLFANLRAIAHLAARNPALAPMLSGVRIQPYVGEQTTHVSANLTRFCDPPRVRGSGDASGGSYPSCGVVTELWNGTASQGKAVLLVPDLRAFSITVPANDRLLIMELLKLNSAYDGKR